ncbi:hypothetical protein HYH03_011198 [Edaphochlamys debaryana]|uniref:Uncharacterized protein n=1 Tax=Edaphochlamys debaryana TaxID=47281 RepID=A0A835XUC0_9CHLO|nr:hypothetical protein HYH03_011198 [Edaphochlamys debaryana]|eukprot:KAG2490398.1 hypothetical protein HYH03_011198 [Edaphochlamys debaryana]
MSLCDGSEALATALGDSARECPEASAGLTGAFAGLLPSEAVNPDDSAYAGKLRLILDILGVLHLLNIVLSPEARDELLLKMHGALIEDSPARQSKQKSNLATEPEDIEEAARGSGPRRLRTTHSAPLSGPLPAPPPSFAPSLPRCASPPAPPSSPPLAPPAPTPSAPQALPRLALRGRPAAPSSAPARLAPSASLRRTGEAAVGAYPGDAAQPSSPGAPRLPFKRAGMQPRPGGWAQGRLAPVNAPHAASSASAAASSTSSSAPHSDQQAPRQTLQGPPTRHRQPLPPPAGCLATAEQLSCSSRMPVPVLGPGPMRSRGSGRAAAGGEAAGRALAVVGQAGGHVARGVAAAAGGAVRWLRRHPLRAAGACGVVTISALSGRAVRLGSRNRRLRGELEALQARLAAAELELMLQRQKKPFWGIFSW